MHITLVLAALIHSGAAALLLRAIPAQQQPMPREEQQGEVLVDFADLSISNEAMIEPTGSVVGSTIAPDPTRRASSSSSSSSSSGKSVGTLESNSNSNPSDEGTTTVLVMEGRDGLARPFGDIHSGFRNTDVDGTPSSSSESTTKKSETLSERGTRTLRDALYARDTSLGLGADGPILQALASVAQASTAPVDGRAVFDVVVGSDGMVTSLSVSEGGIAWGGVAKDALEAVRGKKARVPEGAKGVAIKIELTSRNLLASGHSPQTALSVGGIPITKGDDKAIKVSVLNPIPKIVLVPADAEGKVLIPMAYVEIFGTNVDPTDIGSRPRRVIAAKVTSEHLL